MGNAQLRSATAGEGDKNQAESALQAAEDQDRVTTELAENVAEWYLSCDQKTILRDSWHILQSDIESVGTVTFLRMFETHPETLTAFIPEVEHIREIELDEWYREKLKVHAIRVMAIIEKTMFRLDNEGQAAQILQVYGRRHHEFGVKPPMLDKMAHSFVIAIEPYLEDRWTKKVEESWLALFRRIVFFMELGYPRSARLDCLKVIDGSASQVQTESESPVTNNSLCPSTCFADDNCLSTK